MQGPQQYSQWVLNKIINNMNKITQTNTNRMAKLKLMKDLKYGKVHLRQSLLELSEFQDVDRLFRNRKDFYSIEEQEVHFIKQKTQQNQEQANILISPIQRIELYRKQKMNKKMKQKMTQGLQTKQINHSRPRVPKTTKMLEKFQNKYRNEMPVSYKEQLRESQMNLEKIKRNDKIKFEINNNQKQKPLYQSRFSFIGENTQTEGDNDQNQNVKKRFMSLKTSLPERQRFLYPSIRQIMEGKLKQNIKGPVIDIKRIETTLDGYLNQSMKKMRIRIQKQTQSRNSGINSPTKNLRRLTTYNEPTRKKTKSNVQRSFTRSQQSSKNMIETMSSFYQTKHEKKHNFDVMFNNLKYDRPLTSSIRRKNYTIMGKQTIHPINDYREVSEQQRQKLRQKNYQFYSKLIEGLQIYHEQDIPTTVYIVEQVRRVFETQYLFTQQILKQILQAVSSMELDHRAEDILHRLAAFVGYNLSFTEYQFEEKHSMRQQVKPPLKSPTKAQINKK